MFTSKLAVAAIAGALWVGGLGCAHRVSWTRGFESETYHYELLWNNAPSKTFLPAGWRLDNYDWNARRQEFIEKTEGRYKGQRSLDEDGNGEISLNETREEPLYDLHFVSEKDNGVIWIKAHPILFRTKDKDLTVVVENYVDSLAGRGLYTQGSLFGTVEVKTREFVTFVRDQKSTQVDGSPAVSVVVELAEAEKVKIDASHRSDKVKVIFTRFDYFEEVRRSEENPGWPEYEKLNKRGFKTRLLRKQALLVMGYANSASRFDGLVGDFDAMVPRVKLPIPPEAAPVSSTPAPSPSPPTSSAPPAISAASPASAAPGPPPAP